MDVAFDTRGGADQTFNGVLTAGFFAEHRYPQKRRAIGGFGEEEP
jgi:hypothetical protein